MKKTPEQEIAGLKLEIKAIKKALGNFIAWTAQLFEATSSQYNARLFTQLERDPELEVLREYGYPWIGPVRKRVQP